MGDFKGSEVTVEVKSESSLSVLRWLLQECGSFSPGAPLTALLTQGVQECGMLELDTVRGACVLAVFVCLCISVPCKVLEVLADACITAIWVWGRV